MGVRKAGWIESLEFLTWLFKGKDKNDLDPGILRYPGLSVYVAEDQNKRFAYLPVHPCGVLESLAFNPEAAPGERMNAVLELIKEIGEEAHAAGMRELYYISSDPRIDESAERQGFEKVICYRKRLP